MCALDSWFGLNKQVCLTQAALSTRLVPLTRRWALATRPLACWAPPRAGQARTRLPWCRQTCMPWRAGKSGAWVGMPEGTVAFCSGGEGRPRRVARPGQPCLHEHPSPLEAAAHDARGEALSHVEPLQLDVLRHAQPAQLQGARGRGRGAGGSGGALGAADDSATFVVCRGLPTLSPQPSPAPSTPPF